MSVARTLRYVAARAYVTARETARPVRRLVERRRIISWLERQEPETWRRLQHPDLAHIVREAILDRFASEGYRRWLGRPGPRIEADVIFAPVTATPDFVKDVIALRRVEPALRCCLLAPRLDVHRALYEKHFDEVVVAPHLAQTFASLRNARARAVVASRRGSALMACTARLAWDGRLVYRPYPFAHRQRDGDGDAADFAAERFLLRHADATYHTYSDEAVGALRRDGLEVRGPAEGVFSGCTPELRPAPLTKLSAQDGELHLVYAGGVPHRGEDTAVTWNSALPEKVRVLTRQGLHVHILASQARRENLAEGYQALIREEPRFHYEDSLPYDELLARLTRFDWAFYHMDMERQPHREGFEDFATSGFFTFLDAGLPVVVSPTTKRYAGIVRDHGVGLVVETRNLGDLSGQLRRFPQHELPRRMAEAQAAWDIDHRRLHRLVLGGAPARPPGETGLDLTRTERSRVDQPVAHGVRRGARSRFFLSR